MTIMGRQCCIKHIAPCCSRLKKRYPWYVRMSHVEHRSLLTLVQETHSFPSPCNVRCVASFNCSSLFLMRRNHVILHRRDNLRMLSSFPNHAEYFSIAYSFSPARSFHRPPDTLLRAFQAFGVTDSYILHFRQSSFWFYHVINSEGDILTTIITKYLKCPRLPLCLPQRALC